MGRHRFDPAHAHKLDDPRRLQSEPQVKILDALDVSSARVIVEIGAGSGYYTSHLSTILGAGGIIVACDVSEQMLEILGRRHLGQTQPVLMEEFRLPLKDRTADVVLAANVLHEFVDQEGMLHEVFRVLKPGGQVGIVDWKKQEMAFGPPLQERLDVQEITSQLTKTGFAGIATHDLVQYHNVVSAAKDLE